MLNTPRLEIDASEAGVNVQSLYRFSVWLIGSDSSEGGVFDSILSGRQRQPTVASCAA